MSVPFWKRHDRKLEAITFVVILIPAIAAGCINIGEEETGPTTFSLTAPNVTSRETNFGTVWDAVWTINKVTSDEDNVRWTHVTVTIKDSSGTVLLQATPVSKDSGFYGSAVEVWYNDNSGDANTVDEGDGFKVTGMSRTYQGGRVLFNYRGSVAASSDLPIIF